MTVGVVVLAVLGPVAVATSAIALMTLAEKLLTIRAELRATRRLLDLISEDGYVTLYQAAEGEHVWN